MQNKFGRKYELTIYPSQFLQDEVKGANPSFLDSTDPTIIIIKNPFTLQFNVQRKDWSEAGTATFRIFNLNETNRNKLYRDEFDYTNFRKVVLKAGYSDPLSIIFEGNITGCSSYRAQGQTNFITEIEAQAYGFAMQNSFSNWNWKGTRSKQEIIDRLVSNLGALKVTRGYISSISSVFVEKDVSICDYTWNQLRQRTQNSCFVDAGAINILNDNEYFMGAVNEISSDSGLLGSPKRFTNLVIAELLFEPTLGVGQGVELITKDSKLLSGLYKITGINHFGTISDAVGGDCQTIVSLFSRSRNAKLIERTKPLV